MHHDWLFNFRLLQLRLCFTETIMQLAKRVHNKRNKVMQNASLFALKHIWWYYHASAEATHKNHSLRREMRIASSRFLRILFVTFFTRADIENSILRFPPEKKGARRSQKPVSVSDLRVEVYFKVTLLSICARIKKRKVKRVFTCIWQ